MSAVDTWAEIAEHVYVRRSASYDVNVGLIVGGEQCAVIDTRASLREGTELAAAVRAVTALPCVVVNTHAHFDHYLGNAAFPGVPIWAARRCAEVVARDGIAQRDAVTGGPDDLRTTPVVPPTHTFTTSAHLDLGGRTAQLCFLGRGHTDNDIVVAVPDAGVTFAGDLVEQGAPPAFEDAYPLDWPATLDALLAAARPGPVVPGHGAVVDWAFVRDQRELLARVAAAGRSGDWSGVGLPGDAAAIARARCEWQLASAPQNG